jgi:hypothetical protein
MHPARWLPLLLLAGCVEPRNIPELPDAGAPRPPVVRGPDADPVGSDGAAAPDPMPTIPPDADGGSPAPADGPRPLNADGPAPPPPDARPPPDVRPPDGRPPVPGVGCGAGTHLCGSACYPDTDPDHCGPTCERCPATPNGAPACRQGRCDSACTGNALACSGQPAACVVAAWGFESDTNEGWTLRTGAQAKNAAGPPFVSTTRARTGTRALATEVVTSFAREEYVVTLERSLCESGGLDLGGKTINMYVFFDGPPLNTAVISDPYVYTTEGTSYDPLATGGQRPVVPQAGQWTRISAVVPTNLAHIVTRLAFFSNVNVDGWRGTVYLDDITIE